MGITEEDITRENDLLEIIVNEKAKELLKYFDSVQIFCTKYENDKIGTTHIHTSVGNFFAGYGQIKLWLKKQNLFGG